MADDMDVRRKLGRRVGGAAPDQNQRRRPPEAGIGSRQNVDSLEVHHVADEQDESVPGELAQTGILGAERPDIVGHEVGDDLVGSVASGQSGVTRHRMTDRDEAIHRAPD
jgi:hypothetical protein